VGNYTISSRGAHSAAKDAVPLGEGGSGVVFLAQQRLATNVNVLRAIKFFFYSDKGCDLPGFFGPPVTGKWRARGVLLNSRSGS
jgi:hypothetical protein